MVSIDSFDFPLDPANADQAGEWDGADGEYWATYHEEYERLLGVFDETLVEAVAVGPEDRCLDVGCGSGATTRALAERAVAGSVVGIDLSGPMLAIARETVGRLDLSNVTFLQTDAQVHPFEPGSFDLAVSRMGCMFFADPVAAFGNIGRALRPGGRMALTVWQAVAANGWITAIDEALGEPPAGQDEDEDETASSPGPFSMADPAVCASFLQRADFADIAVKPLDIPLAFGTVEQAQAFLETWIDDDVDQKGRTKAKGSLRRLLVENATPEGVVLPSATWLVTARRPS